MAFDGAVICRSKVTARTARAVLVAQAAEIDSNPVPTVVIAPPAHLGSLKQRDEFKDALIFADTDALRAFEAIARQNAKVVVLDGTFAGTSRGAALINRIKADPLLTECDIRVLGYDDVRAPEGVDASADRADAEAELTAVAIRDSPARPIIPDAPVATPTATRSEMGRVELLIDGTAATLVELSTTGAQVVSTASLKPHQRVRLTLSGATALVVNGAITWAMFEMPASGPCYRADIVFVSPDTTRIAAFIEANRR